MTKEELIQYFFINGYSDEILDLLEEFFSQNVVILKGENRHPYADVMHAKAEGIHLPIQFKGKHDAEFQDTIYPAWDIKTEYRILKKGDMFIPQRRIFFYWFSINDDLGVKVDSIDFNEIVEFLWFKFNVQEKDILWKVSK